MDNAICLSLFLRRWQPLTGIIIDSPFSPQLILAASSHGVKLALLNAKLPADLVRWHSSAANHSRVLSNFDFILPSSEHDYTQLQLFGADLEKMPGWCGDLTSASTLGSGSWLLSQPQGKDITLLTQQLGQTPTWIAAHTEPGEEAVVAQVHLALLSSSSQGGAPGQKMLRTIVSPAGGGWDRRFEIRGEFEALGLTVDNWTHPGATCESHTPQNLLTIVCPV